MSVNMKSLKIVCALLLAAPFLHGAKDENQKDANKKSSIPLLTQTKDKAAIKKALLASRKDTRATD